MLVATALVAALAAATLALRHEAAPPSPPAVAASAAAAGAAAVADHDWPTIDRQVTALLVTARLQQAMALQRRVTALVGTLRGRLDHDFLPWYLSFGRRKFEELGAYNLYARDRMVEWLGGGHQESAQVKLITTFESEFALQVLRPEITKRALREIGRDLADGYANRIAIGLREIQDGAAIPFSAWQTYLSLQPPLVFVDSGGRRHSIALTALTAPDPAWLEIGAAIGDSAAARFERMPSIVDLTALVDAKGRSIFAAGENAAIYFGSYLVYWAALIILLRSGLIPFSVFGFLLGWLLWEVFAWGSWIGVEYLDFEKTRVALSPVIEARAEVYFDHFTVLTADPSPTGPLQALHQMEKGR